MSRWLLHSLQGRVLLTLLLLAMVPLLIVAFQGYHCAREAVYDLAQKHLVSVAKTREAIITEWYAERVKDIKTIASLPGVIGEIIQAESSGVSESEELLKALLSNIQLQDSAFESLSIYTHDWQLIARADFGEHQSEDLLTERLTADLEAADGVFMEEAHMHHSSDVGAHIGRAIQDDTGTRIGYLVGNLNLTRSIGPLLQERSGLWSTGKTYLADRNLRIITEPFVDGERVSLRRNAPAEARECSSEDAPQVLDYVDYRGVEVLGTAVNLPIDDWLLIAEIDRSEALRWLDMLIFRALLTVIVTLVAIVVASTWMSSFLGRPLRQLVTIANRIRIGETNERVPRTQILEADEVGMALNEMLDEMRSQQDFIARTTALTSMGEMTSSIVHEMRNPLSSVKMNLQALSRSLEPGDFNTEAAEIASDQIGRIESMLTDLLQFGRPVSIRKIETRFEELVRMSLAVATDLIQEKEIRCAAESTLDDSTLFIDKEQMCRALSNLIINAVQASPPQSVIRIVLQPSLHGDRFVDLEVVDSGSGLTEMASKRLFQPFFTTKPGGTGLGLANVKKIVELHGGMVSASNGATCGAQIRISIPRTAYSAGLDAIRARQLPAQWSGSVQKK
ncbi:MAG: sensor histidine kinase [Candidatus Hydrogenedentes bacterium]|nr:sensor histidine kinase [Candidatus Hydrogenedentota bacterium]